MPRSYDSLTLDDAKRMLSAAEAQAASFWQRLMTFNTSLVAV
jgi:hypothetical protein